MGLGLKVKFLVQLLLFLHHLPQAKDLVMLVMDLLRRFHHHLLLTGCSKPGLLACVSV